MALNQPTVSNDWELSDIIDFRLDSLVEELGELGITIEKSDIEYSFLDRIEYLKIKSESIYPDEDLSDYFGCGRGYNGGGVHGGLGQTDITHATKAKQTKMAEALDLFAKHFWGTLKDIDSMTAQNEGVEEIESWNQVSL